ncbi:MAG: hypothetical protein ACFFKA_18740, partial [Candidatus Thorarchaeota archaeon]
MNENLQFVYREEFWYVSAFINSNLIDSVVTSKEIEKLIIYKLKTLEEKDIYRKDIKEDLLELSKNVNIQCSWVPYIMDFPYKDEASERQFDIIGYFQFDVEYFEKDPVRKEKVKPMLVQQIPYILLNVLKDYANKEKNKGLFLDTESPIYIFVTSS